VCGDCLAMLQTAMHACVQDGEERRHAEQIARETKSIKGPPIKIPAVPVVEKKEEEKRSSFLSRKKEKEE